MRKRLIVLTVGMMCAVAWQNNLHGDAQPRVTSNTAVVFLRNHNLWIHDSEGERKFSSLQVIGTPKWSLDGKFLAVVGRETKQSSSQSGGVIGSKLKLEVLDAETGSEKVLAHYRDLTSCAFKWSPEGDKLAFARNSKLNLADFQKKGAIRYGVAQGFSDFTWLPDSSGFILASNAQLLPDGWTHARLYTLSLYSSHPAFLNRLQDKKSSLAQRSTVKRLFQLPKVIGESSPMAVTGVRNLKWSRDGQWISFTATPAAMKSVDNARLCVLSRDASVFRIVGSTPATEDWAAWSPAADTLAYIHGSGGDLSRGKKLTIAAAPRSVNRSLSPVGTVDNDFCWLDATHIVVSRRHEGLLDKAPLKREKPQFPALFNIDVERPTIQNRMSNPPEGFGDYHPEVVGWQQVAWIRSHGRLESGEAWLGNADGTEPVLWIKKVALNSLHVFKAT